MKSIETLGDLRDYLNSLTPEQLKLPAQTAKASAMLNEPIECEPIIAAGTMDEMQFPAARSVSNNRFIPEEIVLLTDGSPFGKDGATSYTIEDFKQRDVNGRPKMTPSYEPYDGPTPLKEQQNPKLGPMTPKKMNAGKLGAYNEEILRHRINKPTSRARSPKSTGGKRKKAKYGSK